jgi:anti-sigma-K factor RskA
MGMHVLLAPSGAPRSAIAWIASAALVWLALAPSLAAQQTEQPAVESRARLERRGAGVRVGVWDTRGLAGAVGRDHRSPV